MNTLKNPMVDKLVIIKSIKANHNVDILYDEIVLDKEFQMKR